jgi:hypothetical protein
MSRAVVRSEAFSGLDLTGGAAVADRVIEELTGSPRVSGSADPTQRRRCGHRRLTVSLLSPLSRR